jgi:hypothetical protein
MGAFREHRLHLYLLALAAGVVVVLATLLLVNAGLAIVLAALVVPLVGGVYVLQVSGSQRMPTAAVALSAAIGGAGGAGLALLARLYVEEVAGSRMVVADGRLPLSLVLLMGVTVPLLGDLLELVGPLLLRRWPGVRDGVVDGVILGIASGIGFAATSTVVNFWPIILAGYSPTGLAGTLDWTATLIGLSVLRPLVNGTTSGLIAAGVWAAMLRRGQAAVPVAVGFGGSVIYSLCDFLFLSRGSLAVLALHGVMLAVLLMTLRLTVREALVAGEARAPMPQP